MTDKRRYPARSHPHRTFASERRSCRRSSSGATLWIADLNRKCLAIYQDFSSMFAERARSFSGLGSSLASFQRQIGKACCRPGEASWHEQTMHEQSPDSAVFELAETEDRVWFGKRRLVLPCPNAGCDARASAADWSSIDKRAEAVESRSGWIASDFRDWPLNGVCEPV
jgi:hypothetical protein